MTAAMAAVIAPLTEAARVHLGAPGSLTVLITGACYSVVLLYLLVYVSRYE